MKYGRQDIQKKKRNMTAEKIEQKAGMTLERLLILISVTILVGLVCGGYGIMQGLIKSAPDITEKTKGSRITIQTDYNGVGKLQYLLGQRGIPIVDSQYTDVVKLQLLVEAEKITELKEAVTEATSGKAGWEEEKDLSFAFIEKEPVIF